MSKVKNKIEIIIADDHMMIREGLKQLLELDGTMKVIAEANDGEECLNLLSKKIHPDILLLDINMPKKNGIEVLEHIKQNKIPVKVLILTVHNEVEYLLKAVDSFRYILSLFRSHHLMAGQTEFLLVDAFRDGQGKPVP